LPPGCHIHLQRQTREQVLQGLRTLTTQNWRRLRTELNAYVALRGRSSVRLADFLHDQALELEDVYRSDTGSARSGWTALRRDCGLIAGEPGPEEGYFSRRFGALLHVDDPLRLDALCAIGSGQIHAQEFPSHQALVLQMLAYQVDGLQTQVGGPDDFLTRLERYPHCVEEILGLAKLLQARSSVSPAQIPGLEDTPLCLHAAYEIREVLTAVGWLTSSRRTPFQAGTLTLAARKTELLFVTLDKREGYHDRISYNDYAISTERFHWQSQNTAGPDTDGGRRYIESDSNGWHFQLFMRVRQDDAYRACGGVRMESVEGNRPISIVWTLDTPLPARLFREFSVLRGV
jgi:hypothetical protein